MKVSKIPAIFAVSLFLTHLINADTVVLKNGEEIKGKVIREDEDNVVIEVMVTKSIKDEKTVPRAEIDLVRKVSPESKEFSVIQKLLPTPDLLSEEGYEERITQVEKLIRKYPDARQVVGAKKVLAELRNEVELVRDGGFKFGGEFIAESDYDSNAYEYDVAIAEKEINDTVSRGDYLQVLRLFEDYEEKFNKPESYGEMRQLLLKVLSVYGKSVEQNLESFDRRLKARDNGLQQMAGEDRINSKKAIEEKDALVESRFQQEKDAKETWVTPDPYHEDSLSSAAKQVERTVDRLESSDAREMPEKPLAEVYRSYWKKYGTADEKMRKDFEKDLKKSGLPEAYVKKLEQRAGK
ncbi:PTPDL family protein [Luteolibacter sp. AS25]|uniref:PTPDL family protein n=1 Tax=Luteolibacter sp. AS25 TaxID=3135776 RepID=UPI00398B3254